MVVVQDIQCRCCCKSINAELLKYIICPSCWRLSTQLQLLEGHQGCPGFKTRRREEVKNSTMWWLHNTTRSTASRCDCCYMRDRVAEKSRRSSRNVNTTRYVRPAEWFLLLCEEAENQRVHKVNMWTMMLNIAFCHTFFQSAEHSAKCLVTINRPTERQHTYRITKDHTTGFFQE